MLTGPSEKTKNGKIHLADVHELIDYASTQVTTSFNEEKQTVHEMDYI